jgi:hypothetical protein
MHNLSNLITWVIERGTYWTPNKGNARLMPWGGGQTVLPTWR